MLKQNSRTQTDSECDVAMGAPEPRKNAGWERYNHTFCKHVGTYNHALAEVHLYLPLLADCHRAIRVVLSLARAGG